MFNKIGTTMQSDSTLEILNIDDICFSDASIVDDFGRVFFYEGRVFRAIYENQREHCLTLLDSELFNELQNENLIPLTWISEYQVYGYSLILEHELINESKPYHWSFTMFKDAALLILNINRVCNKYGYELKDAHLYNVFFKYNNPIFIDLGSIIKCKSVAKWNEHAYNEFIYSSYIQLLLWSKGEIFLARKLIEDDHQSFFRTVPMSPILESRFVDFIADDIYDYKISYRKNNIYLSSSPAFTTLLLIKIINKTSQLLLRRSSKIISYKIVLKSLESIEHKIKGIQRFSNNSFWSNYHNVYKSGKIINSTPRFDRIISLVKEHTTDIESVIDLAGNQGVFCQILSKCIKLKRIILTDYDEVAIDSAYLSLKQTNNNIEPFLFNFMRPSKQEDIKILKSDVAFALAITHHLILSQKYLLPAIFNTIAEYANKYVVIEFMPIGLYSNGDPIPSVPDWYNVDWFRNEFKLKFKLLAEEQLEINRIVFIGEK